MPTAVCNGSELDATSDAIDHGLFRSLFLGSPFSPRELLVNSLKGKLWNEIPEFDEGKDKTQFRQYHDACESVRAFYKEQHGPWINVLSLPSGARLSTTEKQTVAFNIQARVDFKSKKRARMGVWEAMEMLNTLIDESDPDVSESEKNVCVTDAHRYLAQTSQSQIEHLLQTAEAIRRDGKPEWMQVGISA